MPVGRFTPFSIALCGALLIPATSRADVYHPVANGDTLPSIAAKYGVSLETLRAANGLQDGDALGAMLLRVPGVEGGQSPISAPTNAVSNTPLGFGASPLAPSGFGSISRSVSETVRAGDSWDTIAARYQKAGHQVSSDDLRRRNNGINAPLAGQTVVVPLGQIKYAAPTESYAPRISVNASAQTPARNAAPVFTPNTPTRASNGGVAVSGEFSLGGLDQNLPTVREIPTQTPIYQSPGRGLPTSRGGFGQMTRQAMGGEVRVLGQNETANAPQTSATVSQPVRPSGSLARVAQVKLSGAKIRRLPQSAAASLFNCTKGTRLAVLRQSAGWSAVLMSDRSTGWLPSKYLGMTDQTVDVTSQIVASPGPGGRASFAGNRYAGENPMVAQALRWLGTRYVYGGTSRRGIDCSALVMKSFSACGYQLPRTAAQQAKVGTAINPASLQSGDRLYFSASGTRIDHTGLYMGDGLFVHASGSGRQVMVSNLFEPRNWNIYVGARR